MLRAVPEFQSRSLFMHLLFLIFPCVFNRIRDIPMSIALLTRRFRKFFDLVTATLLLRF